jgi:hypothetical protein
VEQIEFPSIKRSTSRIGFGCGRLVGGASANESRVIIEVALKAGITHFDVAPSYGLGLAENMLGEVLRGNEEVTIATKVGIARPSGGGALAVARKALRPLAVAAPAVKRFMVGALAATSSREQFDASSIETSFTESLKRLKRPKVDFLLLHEAQRSAITPELIEIFSALVSAGQIGAFGSGTGNSRHELVEFGSVWQYRASPAHEERPPNVNQILHGVLRYGLIDIPDEVAQRADLSQRLGFDLKDKEALPSLFLSAAMAMQQDAVILISSNDPQRIKSSVSQIDWDAANLRRKGFLGAFVELLAAVGAFRSSGSKL